MRKWSILDANDVPLAAIERFCADHAPLVALMVEYIEDLPFSEYLRKFVLCIVDATSGELAGICWIGGNIVPVNVPAQAARKLVREIHRRGNRYSSIVGPKRDVDALWAAAGDRFGTPREIRSTQPHLQIDSRPLVAPDEQVQITAEEDYEILLPAAVDMFTEEVGYSPLSAGGGYERRVRWLVLQRRSMSRIIDGPAGREVIFKADLGTLGYGVTQVQGVWVHPDYRGQGIAAPAMAAVVNYAHQHLAPTVSLYVNDYNAPALATYQRVGFVQTDTFSTILF